jgi:tetratricopeptide (TPR) repeat protein
MGRYEGAIADTLASLSDDPDTMNDRLNAQAYFVAASAHYNLKHFDRAHKFLQKQLKLTPEAKSGQELLKKTNKRLGEQRDGIYNVDAIK